MTIHERPTILLVEDDRAAREMFDYALRMAGFWVQVATDGLSAVRLIDQDLPDVIVLDLDSPYAGGIDTQQDVIAHAETSAIPIIVVTGTEWNTPEGVFQILRKPLTPDDLVAVVIEAVSPPDGTSPSDRIHRRRT